MRFPRLAVLAAAALAVHGLVHGAGEERLLFDVAVRVGFEGEAAGSASLRDDVAQALLAELRARGCFRSCRAAPYGETPRADLLLDVILKDLVEEVRYDQSLAEQARPQDPEQSLLGYSAMLSLEVEVSLAALPGGALVRDARLHVRAERRPRMPGDDARAAARADLLLDLARRARAEACRGSRKKLARGIASARGVP